MSESQEAIYPSLKDRVVFITGGASGIGGAITEKFCEQGAKVFFVDIDDASAHALIARIEARGWPPPRYQHCDLVDIKALQASIERTIATDGAITVLVVCGDLLRWTEVVEPRSWGSGESDRAGREEVVQFEGGLVGRTAEKYERKDCCTVEVYSRSDDGPLGKMSLSFDTLIGGGGGCWRAYWPAEAIRSEEARKQDRELKESREIVWRPGPRWSMTR